jgi:hypothetical protein
MFLDHQAHIAEQALGQAFAPTPEADEVLFYLPVSEVVGPRPASALTRRIVVAGMAVRAERNDLGGWLPSRSCSKNS